MFRLREANLRGVNKKGFDLCRRWKSTVRHRKLSGNIWVNGRISMWRQDEPREGKFRWGFGKWHGYSPITFRHCVLMTFLSGTTKSQWYLNKSRHVTLSEMMKLEIFGRAHLSLRSAAAGLERPLIIKIKAIWCPNVSPAEALLAGAFMRWSKNNFHMWFRAGRVTSATQRKRPRWTQTNSTAAVNPFHCPLPC